MSKGKNEPLRIVLVFFIKSDIQKYNNTNTCTSIKKQAGEKGKKMSG
jgi:hypothetical protein